MDWSFNDKRSGDIHDLHNNDEDTTEFFGDGSVGTTKGTDPYTPYNPEPEEEIKVDTINKGLRDTEYIHEDEDEEESKWDKYKL